MLVEVVPCSSGSKASKVVLICGVDSMDLGMWPRGWAERQAQQPEA